MPTTLIAGSTNELHYATELNGVAAPADSIAVVVTDGAGAVVALADVPAWNALTKRYDLTIASTEIPVSQAGARWTLVWTWVYGGTAIRDAESVLVTEGDASGLCSREQVKSRLGITHTRDDAKIDELLASLPTTAAVRYGREFVGTAAPLTRTFPVRSRLVGLRSCDLRSATSVKLDGVVLVAGTDYRLEPVGGDPLTNTYGTIRLSDCLSSSATFGPVLEVTGVWGIWHDVSEVSEDINVAAIETVLSWLDRPAATVAGIGSDPREVQPAAPATWDFPPSAHRKFWPYSRNLGVY